MDDRQLLELLDADPIAGMDLLWKRYGEPVRFAAAQKLDCDEDIHICVQDTFLTFICKESSSIRKKEVCEPI